MPTKTCLAAAMLLATASATAGRLEDGERVYALHCATCHESGIAEAPQTRKPEDWRDRSRLWQAVLAEHAEHGYLGMPAQRNGLSDYEVDAAAEYMLTITHPDLPRD